MKRSAPLALSMAVLSLVVFYFVFSPPCLIREAAGVRCPLCGMQKSWAAILEGRLEMAFFWNALLLPLTALLILLVLRPPSSSRWLWCVLGAGILFGILRNLPFYPLY